MLFEGFFQSTLFLLGVVAIGGVVSFALAAFRRNRLIHKLGGRALEVPGYWFLFGLDEIQKHVEAGNKNLHREFWEGRFRDAASHTLEVTSLGTRVVFTDDPENIKAILATQFQDYGKGESFHKQWKSFLGDSIFATDGEAWLASRQLIRPQFIKDRVSDLETFERHVGRMLERIPHDGSTVDMLDLFFRLTLDSATDFLLGRSVDSLESPQAEFARAFAAIQRHMNGKTRVGPFRFLVSEENYKKDLKILNDFVEPFVEETLQMRSEELKTKNEKSYNFLHALAEFTKDKQMLRDQIVAVLLAARDTTAATLSWAMYELSKHPEIVTKLRAEILERLGPVTAPTYADLKDMKYTQHLLQETLRLYPAVPFNSRTSLKDTHLPHGSGPDGMSPVGIPAGTRIAYSTLTMQRRVDLFGPDVENFNPDRWCNWTPRSWQYIPFNGGPRICVGQQFALAEMGYVLVRIFQRFESVQLRETEKQFEICEIVMTPGAGVAVSFKPAAVDA